MNYEDAVRVVANSDKSEFERAELIIKAMCRLTNDLLDYRYAVEHYNGNAESTVLIDKKMSIKNSVALLLGDLDVYMEQTNIRHDAKKKAAKRIEKIAIKIDS